MNKDFSKGAVRKITLSQAIPLNGGDNTAITGAGPTFPIITLIVAFAALFGNGGVPLFPT